MSVLDRASLEKSPLADLHALASELGLDGYRRLRKADLIDALIARQGGDPPGDPDRDSVSSDDEDGAARRRRGRRGGRGRSRGAGADDAADDAVNGPAAVLEPAESAGGDPDGDAARSAGRRRGRRRIPGAPVAAEVETEVRDTSGASEVESSGDGSDPVVEGVVELLPNGSGFLRVSPTEPSDDDVYISAAQVKRCELVSGDRISGPRRSPRRSERFPSLIRIDTINGVASTDATSGARFEDLTASFPTERLKFGSEDPTVKAIEWLTPIGKGSRVSIVGPSRAGKTESLLRLADALAGHAGLAVQIVLAGARPEELGEWRSRGEPIAVAALGASPEMQANAIEQALDQARRLVVRGADVVVLIDTLDGISPPAARRALSSARDVADAGSLTVIATSSAPVGGETTVIALDLGLTSTRRFPALDLAASGTMRPELLVGEAGAEAIASARAEALENRQ